jgi:hypothetical protein
MNGNTLRNKGNQIFMLKLRLCAYEGEFCACELFFVLFFAEAGIKLRCFDCEARVKEDCRGFGESSYPENLFVLISILEANGIYKRNEQAALLRDSFDMDITPHQLSETLSRQKRGKKVSEDLTNL